ncbi:hypothetical protein, partial [Brachyspira sp.]|uniref:hypothetical protein n=1 Tax=Brachyspira sp. TaxID=1977261 RepID=UPI003D7DFC70
LLFSISCKPKQNPTPKYSELVGTWKSTYNRNEYILNIDSEGNLIFNCGLVNDKSFHHNFAGKLADTFEYPYTIELTFTASSLSSTSCTVRINDVIEKLNPKSQIGKFTFHDASTLTASVNMLVASSAGGGFVLWYDVYYKVGVQTLNFTKQ